MGQWIDPSLNEAAAGFFGDPFVEYRRAGELPPRRDDRHPVCAPQGADQTVGDDDWLVLTVRDDEEWRPLCAALDRPEWAFDVALATTGGRRARDDELDAAIADWAADRDHREAAELLQAAGVPVAPVLANWKLGTDPHLHERGFYIPIAYPEAGVIPHRRHAVEALADARSGRAVRIAIRRAPRLRLRGAAGPLTRGDRRPRAFRRLRPESDHGAGRTRRAGDPWCLGTCCQRSGGIGPPADIRDHLPTQIVRVEASR